LKTISVGVVDVTETDTAFYLNSVILDNVILNDTDTFIDSASLVDVIENDTGLCLSSVDFPSIILNDTGTPIFSVERMVYNIAVSVMVPDTGIRYF
jgi:predicted RNase H-like nuclease